MPRLAYDPKVHHDHASRILRDVLRPRIFSDHVLLDVAVHQCAEPIPYEEAIRRPYTPVQLGFRWGPIWSTAWFRLRGKVPASFAPGSSSGNSGGSGGGEFRLLFDTQVEALVWWRGGPHQGLEANRQDMKLDGLVTPGQEVEIYIEAACNHLFGVGGFLGSGDGPEGQLKQAHIARYHPAINDLTKDLEALWELAETLNPKTPRSRRVNEAVRDALNLLDPSDVQGTLAATSECIRAAMTEAPDGGANTAHCVGHAHIDLAWLWPLRETRRKCARTFSTVLRNMERHPGYRFIQSQAQAYEWVRLQYPTLFEQIKQRVTEGRWEPGGAMWVESDCNLTSGESLVRQILHGSRYWQKHFGVTQRYLWLPDVFGYSAAMPQILRLSGLDAFFTQKICWNQFNKFPHHSFQWVGIDGTMIPSHFMPADTYNAYNTAKELQYADNNYAQSSVMPHWLQVFGYGDGGGGPTEGQIERVERFGNCAGMPKTRNSRVDEFVDVLLEHAEELPRWVGELYFEKHRGTYTTQARNKRFNRMGERLLQDVELTHCLTGASDAERAEMDRLWKLLLLNQFHDIIPGSSISWVYKDSLAHYEEILTSAGKLLEASLGRAARGAAQDWVVLNTTSRQRDAVVELPPDAAVGQGVVTQKTQDVEGVAGTLALLRDLEPLSTQVLSTAVTGPAGTLRVGELSLENDLIAAKLDSGGRLISLIDKTSGRDAIKLGAPANVFQLYEDRPSDYDAWDVDIHYLEMGHAITSEAEHRVVESGPVRVAIEFRRKVGAASTMVQRVQLAAGSRLVEFDTWVDWHEDNRFLRVLHPIDVLSDYATYEIQFGHLRRPTHFNTTWDYARFEVCAQRWMDLSEPGFGVSLVNDCKYGHSCHGNVMGLSLLRSTKLPDPEADMTGHRFRYALMVHGSFDAGQTVAAAETLNQPMRVAKAGVGSSTSTSTSGAGGGQATQVATLPALAGPHATGVVIDTVKLAEEGPGTILRLYECGGGRGQVELRLPSGIASAEEVDLMERPMGIQTIESGGIKLDFKPFQIRSIRLW